MWWYVKKKVLGSLVLVMADRSFSLLRGEAMKIVRKLPTAKF